MLQSALALDIDSIDADIVANAAGGTARINAGQLDVVVPNRFDGVPATGHANLDWTRVGYWDNSAPVWDDFGDPSNRGAFVTGYRTPPADVPTSGAATYTGVAQGSVFYPRSITGRLQARDQEVYLAGTASLTADFGTRSVTGTLTGMTAVHRAEGGMIPPWNGALPWNDLAFTATVAGNGFSGSTSVTSTPSGIASLSAGATGTIEGGFFGPTAQETGAVWTLFDGTRAAIGTLSGKRP